MDNTIEVSTEDLARMVNSHWGQLRKKNKWKFSSKEEEDECKALFILGYHCAWVDMREISSGAMSMDNQLGIYK